MAALAYRFVSTWALVLVVGLCPGLCSAQPAAPDSASADTTDVQWELELPPLTVTASRIPTSPATAPARITVLDSAALHQSGAPSVADVLDARSGVHVRRYGEGGLATPALRGSGASQTALLLDGQRISNPQIGHLDLSLLPTALLRSVEVMHGPASAVHGSDGLGGAIHLRTVRPRSSLHGQATGRIGAFGERGGSLLVGGPVANRTSVLVAGDVQATDGDFPYLDDAKFPPQTVRRRNADRLRQSLYGSVRSSQGRHHLRVSGWLTSAERGLPPTTATAPAQERLWDTQLRIWARDHVDLSAGTLTLKALTEYNRLRYVNPPQNVDQTGRTWSHSLEVRHQTPLNANWIVSGGLLGRRAQARHPSLQDRVHQEQLAAFVEATGTYGTVRFYPALRTDTYWMPDGPLRRAISPRLGLNIQPFNAWQNVYLKAQVGRAFRVPTFNDRYWEPGGNPDLRPEKSWGGDIGVRLDRSHAHVEVTAFGHRRRDQIVWQPTGQGYWAPRNVGRVRALGAEVSAEAAWTLPGTLPFRAGMTYTVTDARNRSDPESDSYNEPLRYVPLDQMKAHSTVSMGSISVSIHARYTGHRYVTSDGSQTLPAYVLVHPQVQLRHDIAGVKTELSLEIDNLLNKTYESVGGRPMPPRHARVRLLVAP